MGGGERRDLDSTSLRSPPARSFRPPVQLESLGDRLAMWRRGLWSLRDGLAMWRRGLWSLR
eukprot:167702-Pyramimonas_sp.AAC.1